ncbi:putative immunity protein [Actinocrispum sp. NPDC049592]|uniref:putative immunity protein n=1 Tax=Actinocrispum sp. NPDC049592 TaxID=3154835 RepID=UPI003426AEF1
MGTDTDEVELSKQDLREVTAFAAACAETALEIFEAAQPDDTRPRNAIAVAWAFARGGERGKALRDAAWAAQKAANSTDSDAAREAGRAAMAAAGAAYLHPLAKATQVKHILGSAAHAARASELAAGDPTVGVQHIQQAADRVSPAVIAVLKRFPAAPGGGGRVGELVRLLDNALR